MESASRGTGREPRSSTLKSVGLSTNTGLILYQTDGCPRVTLMGWYLHFQKSEKKVHAQHRYVTTDLTKEGWLRRLFIVDPCPAAAASPGCSLEMQNLGPHPDLQSQNIHSSRSSGPPEHSRV